MLKRSKRTASAKIPISVKLRFSLPIDFATVRYCTTAKAKIIEGTFQTFRAIFSYQVNTTVQLKIDFHNFSVMAEIITTS